MGRIKLADEDRERYGAPEWLPFQYGRWGLKVVDALEQEVGWTVEDLGNAMSRKFLDDDGQQVVEDGVELFRPRPMAVAAVAWMALLSNGIRVPWAEFDIARPTVEWADDAGKAPEDQDSATSSTSS
jgi:hypothetical protein